MLTNALRPFKQMAYDRLRSIVHFVKPGAHAYSGKYDRVRRVALTKETTNNPALLGWVS